MRCSPVLLNQQENGISTTYTKGVQMNIVVAVKVVPDDQDIQVTAAGTDPEAVGKSIYDVAERYLLRTLQGAI